MWPAVKKPILPADFEGSLETVAGMTWRPQFIVLHNTSEPTLKQRPDGFTKSHIEALENYYKNDQRWSGGPHYFIDDHCIWVFNPLQYPGVHSPSWNKIAIGIEMLGEYNVESFESGRGLLVRRNTVIAMAALSKKLGFKPDGWKFHREDPRTDHDCPGTNAFKVRAALVSEIGAQMNVSKAHPWDLPLPDAAFKKG